jgi:FtsP/CotA-like multicopper oxidase with cupredoxin domain
VNREELLTLDDVLIEDGKVVAFSHFTNPGHWMAHCHIAEHHESGMMFSFNVEAAA